MTAWRYFCLFNCHRNNILLLLFSFFIFHFSFFTNGYAEPPKRIVSLSPGTTEILFAMGIGDRIVGVTSFCDYPEEAKKKPQVGGMSNPSLEAVVSLKPDIVVLTTDGNPKHFEERLRSLDIKTYIFKARRLSELPDGIRNLGSALGLKERAEALAKDINKAINRFTDKSQTMYTTLPHLVKREHRGSKKKVLFIVWPKPLIVAGPGTVIDDALNLIGAENIASDAKTNYPKYSIEEILRQAPDIIFIGSGHEDMKKVSAGLLKRLKSVSAVKNKRVFFVSDLLYRLGPRTIKGIEELDKYLEK